MDFSGFPKIARLNRDCVISEKIDGTNASILIKESLPGEFDVAAAPDPLVINHFFHDDGRVWEIFAGSRTRWITTRNDNYGVAKWVETNMADLLKLGPGHHFGEWWGGGIQRGYGLPKGEKRFSLFNTSRWADDSVRPSCCGVVPVLYDGLFNSFAVQQALATLRERGSLAAPGFMNPEGVVVYHVAANVSFKVTLENDEKPKGRVNG